MSNDAGDPQQKTSNSHSSAASSNGTPPDLADTAAAQLTASMKAGTMAAQDVTRAAAQAAKEVVVTLENLASSDDDRVVIVASKEASKNDLRVTLTNYSKQDVLFRGGKAPTDPGTSSGPSGIYLYFYNLNKTAVEKFSVETTGWSGRVVEKSRFGVQISGLLIDHDGDVEVPRHGGTVPIQLSIDDPAALKSTSGLLEVQFPRLKNAPTSFTSQGYEVAVPGQQAPTNLATRFAGDHRVPLQITGQNVPKGTLELELRNTKPSGPFLDGSDNFSAADAPSFIFQPSTVPAGPAPDASVLMTRKAAINQMNAVPKNQEARMQWTVHRYGTGFVFRPKASSNQHVLGPKNGENAAARFRITGIVPISEVGPANTYVFIRNLPGYADTARVRLVDKVHAPPTVKHFTASKKTVDYEEAVELSWETYGYESTTSLSVDGNVVGTDLEHNGSMVVYPKAHHTQCWLTCKPADGGNRTADYEHLDLTVRPPRIDHFTIDPSKVSWDEDATLKWDVSSAGEVEIYEKLPGGTKKLHTSEHLSGSLSVSPQIEERPSSTTYRAEAEGTSKAEATVCVSVDYAPIRGIGAIGFRGGYGTKVNLWKPLKGIESLATVPTPPVRRPSRKRFTITDFFYRPPYIYCLTSASVLGPSLKNVFTFSLARVTLAGHADQIGGEYGFGLKQHNRPESLAVGADGWLYVAANTESVNESVLQAIDPSKPGDELHLQTTSPPLLLGGIPKQEVQNRFNAAPPILSYDEEHHQITLPFVKEMGMQVKRGGNGLLLPISVQEIVGKEAASNYAVSGKTSVYVRRSDNHVVYSPDRAKHTRTVATIDHDCVDMVIEPSTRDALWIERDLSGNTTLSRYLRKRDETVTLSTEVDGPFVLLPEKEI